MTNVHKPTMPEVHQHLEVFAILKRISRDRITAEQGYDELAEIVRQYLWDGACEGHGELIGNQIASVLLHNNSERLSESYRTTWTTLSHTPGSPLAAARGVLLISVLFGIATDQEVEAGARRLYKEYMTRLFPPSSYLFRTTFSVLRGPEEDWR